MNYETEIDMVISDAINKKSEKEFGLGGPGQARQISQSQIERIRIDLNGHSGARYPHYNQDIYPISESGKVIENVAGQIKPIAKGQLDHLLYTYGGSS